MSKLFRTDKMIEDALSQPAGPSADAIFTVQQLGELLAGITRQLDLLIRLECGVLKRSDLKERIRTAEAEVRIMADAAEEVGAGSTNDPALD